MMNKNGSAEYFCFDPKSLEISRHTVQIRLDTDQKQWAVKPLPKEMRFKDPGVVECEVSLGLVQEVKIDSFKLVKNTMAKSAQEEG